MTVTIGRRELLVALGGAAAWPVAARAQQPAMPTVGFLGLGSPRPMGRLVAAFRQGLAKAGYVEGQNEEGGPHHSLHRALHSRKSCSTVTDEIVRIQYLLPHEPRAPGSNSLDCDLDARQCAFDFTLHPLNLGLEESLQPKFGREYFKSVDRI